MKIRSVIIAVLMAALTAGILLAQEANKSKALVVYFSRTGENYGVGNITEGNTAILAKMIAAKTGADTFEIVPVKSYPDKYKECTDVAKEEQRKKARPEYKGDIDISGYDTIFIGYPIWWSDLPMVVYTFLEKHDFGGKTILPFCTHEGSGLSGTDRTIKSVCKGSVVKPAFAIQGRTAQNKRNDAEKEIISWLKKNNF